MIHNSHSVAQTESIAAELARTLVGGECIALDGPLGAGKTQFVRGLAVALGADPRAVSSPTFVLLNIYRGGRVPLFHLDAYRVAGGEDFESIGFSELLEQNGVVVVEWASRVEKILPGVRINVSIEVTGKADRRIGIDRVGILGEIAGEDPRRRNFDRLSAGVGVRGNSLSGSKGGAFLARAVCSIWRTRCLERPILSRPARRWRGGLR